tara:strand:+ start:209 stop:649 length:441 start_codon:yes stop_codon:yes gene_type:complete
MTKLIHIDDYVSYRGGFGSDTPKQAMVTGFTLTKEPRDKYGVEVSRVSLEEIAENRVVFSFDDGHWAYSEQVDGWVDTTIGVTVPIRPELSINEKEARDISAVLSEWKDHLGTIEDLDNNKSGLTEERYEALMQKLTDFINKERLV